MALTGYGTPKRAVNLMSRLGMTLSYQTIVRTLKLMAMVSSEEVKELAQRVPLGCAYDNLNKEQRTGILKQLRIAPDILTVDHSGTETIENRTQAAYKLTVNLV